MLYECAITPDVFDAVAINDQQKSYALIQVLRDVLNKGTIANMCGGTLIRHIQDTRFPGLDQTVKSEIMTCLNNLKSRNRLVNYTQAGLTLPQSDLQWLMEVMHYHVDVQFYAIIMSKLLMNTYLSTHAPDSAFIEYTTIPNSLRWQEVQNSMGVSLSKSEADYQRFLTPVLRHAKKLTLVDPYLRCDDQNESYSTFKTIEICARLMRNAFPGYIYLYVQSPDKKVESKVRKEWMKSLQPLSNSYKHHFTVFVCVTEGRHRFHNRYIMTDQCCIMSPDTLDCARFAHASNNVWSLLDAKIHDECFQELHRINRRKLCEVKPE